MAPLLKQSIGEVYVMVDIICVGLVELWGTLSKRGLQNEKVLSTVGFYPKTLGLKGIRLNHSITDSGGRHRLQLKVIVFTGYRSILYNNFIGHAVDQAEYVLKLCLVMGAEFRSVCRGICRELCLVTWCESWSTKRLPRKLSWTMSSYLMGELKHEAFVAEIVVNYV